MKTYIGLLRAVNILGKNAVPMKELRVLLTKLGMQDVQTLLQSGNVVFKSDAASAAELEQQLGGAIAKKFGARTELFLRTTSEWKKIIANNPFPIAAAQDPGHMIVMPLRKAPAERAVIALRSAIEGKGREMVQAKGTCAYFVYPDGVGHSKLTTALIEKHFATRGTARNWNTVLKLATAAGIAPGR